MHRTAGGCRPQLMMAGMKGKMSMNVIGIGNRIKHVRLCLGMTQTDFGAGISITQATISNIENGKENATQKIIQLICMEYGINEEFILECEGDVFSEEVKLQYRGIFVCAMESLDCNLKIVECLKAGDVTHALYQLGIQAANLHRIDKMVSHLASHEK